jgi:hypothetical protein
MLADQQVLYENQRGYVTLSDKMISLLSGYTHLGKPTSLLRRYSPPTLHPIH